MAEYETLKYETDGAIATITLNRPESLNALNPTMLQELQQVVSQVEMDDAIRCVVLTGAGDHFMAGGDVKGFHKQLGEDIAIRKPRLENEIEILHTFVYRIQRMEKPVIAKIRGAVAGFGLSLAISCDLAIAADDSFYTLAYVNIGTSPDGMSTWFLPRVVGLKNAMEIAMLGDRFGADVAKQYGLLNRVVPAGDLDAEVDKLAKRLANGPTAVFGRIKRLLYASSTNSPQDQSWLEAQCFAESATSHDFAEGVTAFVEKRAPKFNGK